MRTPAHPVPDLGRSPRRGSRHALPALALTLGAALAGTVLTATPASSAELICHGTEVTIEGTGKRDRIRGTTGDDVIWAGGGNDVVDGNGGQDIICGGPGVDELTGSSGTDVLIGGPGDDRLEGMPGTIDQLEGGPGIDTLIAAAPGSQVFGGPHRDNILGSGPQQILEGDGGPDRIKADGIEASIEGGAGNDRILNPASNSWLIDGGEDDDTIRTGDGPDGTEAQPIDGGPGNDTITTGMDTDLVVGDLGRDTIDLGDGNGGYAYGDDGKDVLNSHQAGSELHGGAGVDIIATTAPGVTIFGEDGADELFGNEDPNAIQGGPGNDLIDADAGDDTEIDGGPGDDTIDGGDGDDVLHGGADKDTMSSGAGAADVLHGDDGADDLTSESAGGRAEGGPGDDHLFAAAPEVLLLGDDGDDVLGGNDVAVLARGGADADTLVGGSEGDELYGGGGDDYLDGKGGADVLYGEEGVDTCAGGGGTDMCDGGPMGTPAPSPDDPDTCKADVENKFNCRDESGFWGGTADGVLAFGDGVQETWSATYSMDPWIEGVTSYRGDASISWSISGTDDQGCTYDGAESLPGKASLTTWRELGTYDVQVWAVLDKQYFVTVDCPLTEPTLEAYHPMNTNAADGSGLLPEAPVRQLSGSAEYKPMNGGPGSQASWSWSINRN